MVWRVGPAPSLIGAVASGIWLVLIGWFVIASATCEERATLLKLLRGRLNAQAVTADRSSPQPAPQSFLADPAFRYRHSAFPVPTKSAANSLASVDSRRNRFG